MADLDLYGADDVLDALGMGVGGEDFVGAAGPNMAGIKLNAQAVGNIRAAQLQSAARRGIMSVSPAMLAAAQTGAQVIRHQQKTARLRQLAYAGLIPQIPMGVRSNSVAANSTTTISPEPGVPLRITNLTVSPTIAGLFLITQIKVARVDMLAGSDAVPATLFAPESRHPPFENPILAAGSQIVLGVENIDAGAHPFYGAFVGIDLTPPYARYV